jgi:hypothetical protein
MSETIIAASCPISYEQFQTGRQWGKNPYSPLGKLKDQINSIPRAHDLPTVIRALTIMNNIIMLLTRGEPMVNNTVIPGEPSVVLKGEDNNPNYVDADWILEGRTYERQTLVNPEDNDQWIELKILRSISFYNINDGSRLNYYGPGSGLRMIGEGGY